MRLRILFFGAAVAGLAACTAATHSGPVNTVTAPAVGRPAPPGSVEAALARMPFYPYTVLGQSDNDALAPGESSTALGMACVAAAGYPGTAGTLGIQVRLSSAGLGFAQDWGPWGYLGAADAQEYGFRAKPVRAMQELGLMPAGSSGPGNLAALPAAEQSALGKCDTIKLNFLNAMFSGPLAGITTMANDITTDLADDPAVKSATSAWAACMKRNGYDYASPLAAVNAQMTALYGNSTGITANQTISSAANAAQIAAAVTDSDCTQSSDLAGIYFAAEASYEQQVMNANQTALAAAVSRFRTDYEREVSQLPSLLATTKASQFPKQVVGTPSARARI